MDIYVASISWLLLLVLQWTLGYQCLFELLFSQGICPVVGFLGHIIVATVVVQALSPVWHFATQWTTPHEASLSFTMSQSLLILMSLESVMPSNHLIFCCPLLLLPSIFLSIRVFTSVCQSIRGSASALVLPMKIQHWFLLGLTGLISLMSKGFSWVFSSTTVQKH